MRRAMDHALHDLGGLRRALGAIKAEASAIPGQTGLDFPPEDSEFEAAHMPNARLKELLGS